VIEVTPVVKIQLVFPAPGKKSVDEEDKEVENPISPQNECRISTSAFTLVYYYKSIKQEIKTRTIYECRCDERLKTKDEKSTLLTYTRYTLGL
jgi:hypothetical protein